MSNTGSACATSRSNWNWFLRRGENRSTRRKTSRSRVENQQQTQPTYDAGSGNRTRDRLVGGERSHHCANLAPAPLGFLSLRNVLLSFKNTESSKQTSDQRKNGLYLGVRACELFLCLQLLLGLRSIVLTSLFSLFYVTRECHRFLHRGKPKKWITFLAVHI